MDHTAVAGVTKAQVVREAQRRVARNHLGLPEGFHRTDLLPVDGEHSVVKGKQALSAAFGGSQQTQAATSQALGDQQTLVLDERLLQAAYVPLNYDEGFPTLPDGRPFWAQLDFEPFEAYLAFQAYLEQGTKGKRQLALLVADTNLQRRIVAARDVGTPADLLDAQDLLEGPLDPEEPHPRSRRALAPSQPDGDFEGMISQTPAVALLSGAKPPVEGGVPSAGFQEWFVTYYWGARAKAYDLFYLDSIRTSRNMLSLQLENRHFLDASRLYNKVMLFIEPTTPDGVRKPNAPAEAFDDDGQARFWREASPRTMIELLNTAAKLQRLSLGAPAAAPSHQVTPLGPSSPAHASRAAGEEVAGAAAQVGDLDPEERVRRIAALINVAKARKEAAAT